MKSLLVTTLLLVTCSHAAIAEIKVGSTRAEVIDEWGQPTGMMRDATGEELVYHQASVTLQEGRVTKILSLPASTASAVETNRIAKSVATSFEETDHEADVKVVGEKGATVALADLLVHGKVTVVDFYADWCGPCRQLAPSLEDIAKRDAEVAIRKVNIGNWGTPVAKQYGLTSIPNVRVYDWRGNQVGIALHKVEKSSRTSKLLKRIDV